MVTSMLSMYCQMVRIQMRQSLFSHYKKSNLGYICTNLLVVVEFYDLCLGDINYFKTIKIVQAYESWRLCVSWFLGITPY